MTLAAFIAAHRLTMTAERTDSNPHMDDSAQMDHWRCIIRRPRHSFTVYFSQGYGHNGKAPKLAAVLECLASDASSLDNARDFEDWAGDYGYSTDSRKAEKIFSTVTKQAARLKRFLGDDAYTELLRAEAE
jgi:hypothetical protein